MAKGCSHDWLRRQSAPKGVVGRYFVYEITFFCSYCDGELQKEIKLPRGRLVKKAEEPVIPTPLPMSESELTRVIASRLGKDDEEGKGGTR